MAAADNGTAEKLRLAGTAYAVSVSADGSYSFGAVAPGAFALVAQLNQGGAMHQTLACSFEMTAGEQFVKNDILAFADKILIDDFTAGWGQTALGRIIGAGKWYTATDVEYGGKSSVSVSVVSDTQAYSGKSIRGEYLLNSSVVDPWSIIGFNIGTSLKGTTYDFSSLKAISFRAKGKGNVNVTFLSKTISRIYQDSAQFCYNLQIPPDWTLISIPVDSLRLPDNAPAALKSYTWQQVAPEIQTVDFTVEWPYSSPGDTVILWLDELFLEGISLDNFVK
jgi:hypothetical protein